MSLADDLTAAKAPSKLGALSELLERSGIDVDDISRVERVNCWQGFWKDDEGEAHTVDLHGISLVPKWADGPAWPVVQPAKPTIVRPLSIKPSKLKETAETVNTTVILPDPQIGFRRYEDGVLDPFHDEQAMAVALHLVRFLRPEAIVNLGDTLDFAEWSSKFLVSPEFVLTTQATLDRAHVWLAEQRANAPEADITILPGNHDDRLGNAITRNAMAALRLRPAATPPDTWPVLSLPFLLRLDDLDVTMAGGYPAGKVLVALGTKSQPPLYAIHGKKLDVVKVARTERQSYVQGHIHRVADHHETYEMSGRAVTVNAWSPGCLCRLDGAVPSTKSGTDEFGRPVPIVENWQHGLGVVTTLPDGSWSKEIVRIDEGRAVFRGKVFEA